MEGHDSGISQQTQNICIINMCTRLDQRWADVVQMLYKCFVFTGIYGSITVTEKENWLIQSDTRQN